jgi:ribose transport system ATP-binding protein
MSESAPDISAAPARLTMRRVSKRFGATVALSGVDIQVAAGEVHALVGENGAGKSTLMKILSGAIKADSGEMALDGQTYTPEGPLDARTHGVAMIYQELSLVPHLSVMENILLGVEPRRFGIVGGAFGILNRREMQERAVRAIAELGHPEIRPETPVGRLSIAAAQLVEIARAIAIGSRVLIFDEPTSSLTSDDIEKLFKLIERLKSGGHAIVYISHFLEEVSQISDRYTVLRDGQTVGTGPIDQIDHDGLIRLMVGRDVDSLYP